MHSGITGLVEMVYNRPPTGHVVLILDNSFSMGAKDSVKDDAEHSATVRFTPRSRSPVTPAKTTGSPSGNKLEPDDGSRASLFPTRHGTGGAGEGGCTRVERGVQPLDLLAAGVIVVTILTCVVGIPLLGRLAQANASPTSAPPTQATPTQTATATATATQAPTAITRLTTSPITGSAWPMSAPTANTADASSRWGRWSSL